MGAVGRLLGAGNEAKPEGFVGSCVCADEFDNVYGCALESVVVQSR